MPILQLSPDWEITENVALAVTAAQLGEGYSQISVRDSVRRTWAIRAYAKTATELAGFEALIRPLQGDRPFQWQPGPSIALADYFCSGYRITEYPLHWAIEAEFFSDGGQCELYRTAINDAQLVGQVAGAATWLASYTRNTVPFAISTAGLLAHQFHTSPGQGGLYPPYAAILRNQAQLVVALIRAKAMPGIASTITSLNSLIGLLSGGLAQFRDAAPPSTPSVWPHHYLVNAGPSFTSRGSQAEGFLRKVGYYSPLAMSGGVGAIASNVATIARIHTGPRLWNSQDTPLRNGGVDRGLTSWAATWPFNSTNYAFYPNSLCPGQARPLVTAQSPGYLDCSPSYSGTVDVISTRNDGVAIATGGRFTAFPTWAPIAANNFVFDFAAAFELDVAFEALFADTGATVWSQARAANQFTINALSAPTLRRIFKAAAVGILELPGIEGASTGSAFTFDREGTAYRLTSLGAATSLTLSNWALSVPVDGTTIWTIGAASSVATVLEFAINASPQLSAAGEYVAYWVVPAGSSANNATFTPSQFAQWGADTWWHAPDTVAVSGATTNTWVWDSSNFVARLALSGSDWATLTLTAPTNRPPAIRYRSDSTAILQIQDGAGTWYQWNLPAAPTYTTFTPTGFASGAASNIQSIRLGGTASPTNLWLHWLGAAPNLFPTPSAAHAHHLRSRVSGVSVLRVWDCTINGAYTLKYPDAAPPLLGVLGTTAFTRYGGLSVASQSPSYWAKLGNVTKALAIAQCLGDAQIAYGGTGPLRPTFGWPNPDDASSYLGNYNTWQWASPATSDDQTMGKTYLALESLAEAWWRLQANAQFVGVARPIVMATLTWLATSATTNNSGQPPTQNPSNTTPTITYHNPGFAAQCLKIAIYANLAGGDPAITYRVLRRSLDYLIAQYVASGNMAGAWSASQPVWSTFTEYNPTWSGEIIEAYALLLANKAALTLPPCGISI
jgi:phage-related protein